MAHEQAVSGGKPRALLWSAAQIATRFARANARRPEPERLSPSAAQGQEGGSELQQRQEPVELRKIVRAVCRTVTIGDAVQTQSEGFLEQLFHMTFAHSEERAARPERAGTRANRRTPL
jgi:hypothetical protein